MPRLARRFLIWSLPVVLLGLVALAVVLQLRYQRIEGYFSPIYDDAGGSVYFIHRRTAGLTWGFGYEFFTAPAHSLAFRDDISLRRLDLESGAVEVVRRWPPSPIVGRYLRPYRGRLFTVLGTVLRWNGVDGIDYEVVISIPTVPSSEIFTVSQRGDGDRWVAGPRRMGGGDRFPLFDATELFAVPGDEAYPAAIIAYDHRTAKSAVLLKTAAYDRLYPDGVPRRLIDERSRRADIERTRTLTGTEDALVEHYRRIGMSEGEAMLKAADTLQQLGFLPKRPTITARRLEPGGASPTDPAQVPLYTVADGEMQSGVFPDIERAIAEPDTAVKRSMGAYVIHRDYANSALLNAFIDGGGNRFRIEFQGATYELTIDRP